MEDTIQYNYVGFIMVQRINFAKETMSTNSNPNIMK